MTELATDSFDRANSGTLGANWSAGTGASGQFEILSNAANCPNGTGTAVDYYNAVTWPADQYSEAVIGNVSTTSDEGSGPSVRWATSAHTGYFVQCNSVETKLYKVNSGTYSQLPNGSTNGPPVTTGDTIRIEISGSSITVKKNGTSILTATDSTITSGNAGIWGSAGSGASTLTSWSGGDLTGGGGGPAIMGRRLFILP